MLTARELLTLSLSLSCRSGQGGRLASEPVGGLTSLKGEPPGPGFKVRSDL